MRNLISFFRKSGSWFLFVIYLAIGFVWLFTDRRYQQSVYLSSANSISSSVYEVSGSITGYFNLREINDELQIRNASLENELLNLKSELDYYKSLAENDSLPDDVPINRFSYVTANVTVNSINKPFNYFTINKGSNSGIEKGMGVVNQNGIVGIVNVVGPHASRVISLLNETQHFSVKVKGTQSVGSLQWKVGNPAVAYVEDLPRHLLYHVGDTVVTSGYSTTFPEGIPVGVVLGEVKTKDSNFVSLKLRLLSNFNNLRTVRVILDNMKNEIDSLSRFDAQPPQIQE